MLRWRAAYADAPGDALRVDDVPLPIADRARRRPRSRWDDPALPAALSDDLGRAVTLQPRPRADAGPQRLDPRHDPGDARRGRRELGRALDLRRFRTNIHVVLDDDTPPYAEEAGRAAGCSVGDVTLDLLHPCVRCVIPTRDPDTRSRTPTSSSGSRASTAGLFGINARLARTGPCAVGDQVALA